MAAGLQVVVAPASPPTTASAFLTVASASTPNAKQRLKRRLRRSTTVSNVTTNHEKNFPIDAFLTAASCPKKDFYTPAPHPQKHATDFCTAYSK